jgi:hypothetical protein
MTNPTQPKAIPNPAVLVFGKPTSPDLPQASWFRAEDRPTVIAAAQSLKFSVLDIQTDAERALTLGVHEGVLKGNGRMIVGSVTPEVYKRIEEYVAKATGAPASKATSDGAAGTKPASEQTANSGEKGAPAPSTDKAAHAASAHQAGAPASKPTSPETTEVKPSSEQPANADDKHAPTPSPAKAAPMAPDGKTEATTAATPSNGKPEPIPARDPWDRLSIGSYVLGKYWNRDREPIGWWLGIITDIDKNDFIIRWPDEPNTPPLKIERKHIAILHPSFDFTREWDRKR